MTTIDGEAAAGPEAPGGVRDPGWYRRAVESLVGVPATDGNDVRVLRNGREIFPAMLDAIRSATSSVDFLTYVYWTGEPADRFADALAERAVDGVRVRVLLDAIGARLMDDGLVEQLEDAGAQVERFRPLEDPRLWEKSHRTHRRVLVVDGRVGFTGGVGIAEEWMGDARGPGEWRDTHVRVTGPAVDGLRAGFLENWTETGRPLVDGDLLVDHERAGDVPLAVVRSSAAHGVSTMSILKRVLIYVARKRVDITSAYLAPEEGAYRALEDACGRGVEVRLLVPGQHVDKRVAQVAARDQFESLLDIGVRIFTYEPTMLHAKTMVVDGVVTDIGSANFNSRSFSQDEEIDVVAFSEPLGTLLTEHFEDDLESASEVTPEAWEQRGLVQRAAENIVGLADDVM